MTMELPKHYDPRDAQARWLRFWNERGFFHARPDPNRQPFCIVIPPPNVTGALHLGHALNNTLQDVLIRWRRMQGYNVLWMPGTDHAGIATQAVVERRLREEEKSSVSWVVAAIGSVHVSPSIRSAPAPSALRFSRCSKMDSSTGANGW